MSRAAVPIAIVGPGGFGHYYRRRIADLTLTGRVRLVGVVDVAEPVDFPDVPAGTPWYRSLDELLDSADRPAVVTISTPIPTHVPLALRALEAGCDVMLEKPPAPSLLAYEELLAAVSATGRRCQVGFQTFGSTAFALIAGLIADGAIGQVERIGAVGLWVRDVAYWSRSRWAGRRRLDGIDVVDGVVTNPFAHAIATGLRLGGVRGAADIAHLTVDLFHANSIEADDTSAVQIDSRRGLPFGFALSVCAPVRRPAQVTVYGREGRIIYYYETDRIEVLDRDTVTVLEATRVPLLDDLLDARERGDDTLQCPLADTGGFMAVLDAIRQAPAVQPIPETLVTWRGEGPGRHPVVHDIEAWAERVATRSATFTEVGAPWT